MNLETQLRRSLLSLALVGGTLGVIVSQAESRAVEGMMAQEVAAACQAVLPAEADQVGPVRVASGRNKVGSFLGDHTKTGLNSLFNTGTSVGAFANVLSAGRQNWRSLLPAVVIRTRH